MKYMNTVLAKMFNLSLDRAPKQEIAERIKSDAELRGTNMAILILAILIASIGLNMNSPAVVIGAMLISPLMGVIIGLAYGMATYDSDYVKRCLFRWLFQSIFSILASAIYFWISPIETPSSELIARISPTIWDVLIAIFGGLAGIIGNTRMEKNNVIPGVAIATALMPPLCTAGYGLAHRSWEFFSGALYLYFINCFFICLTSIFVLKLLKMPVKEYVSSLIFKRQKYVLLSLGIITVIPSLFFAYQSVKSNLENAQATAYIKHEFLDEDSQVVSYNLKKDSKVFEIILIGPNLNDTEQRKLRQALTRYTQISDYKLKIVQSAQGMDKHQLEALIIDNIKRRDKEQADSNINIKEIAKSKNLSEKYYTSYNNSEKTRQLVDAFNREAPIIFPEIASIEGGLLSGIEAGGKIKQDQFMVIVYVKQRISPDNVVRLKKWMSEQAQLPIIMNVQLITDKPSEVISGNGISW